MKKEPSTFMLITYVTKHSSFFVMIPVLIVSLGFGWLYHNADFESNLFIPGESTASIQIIEGVILVALTILSGLLMVLALKYNKKNILRIFFGVGLFLTSLSVLWLHGYFLEQLILALQKSFFKEFLIGNHLSLHLDLEK